MAISCEICQLPLSADRSSHYGRHLATATAVIDEATRTGTTDSDRIVAARLWVKICRREMWKTSRPGLAAIFGRS
jgi:hypothetical protein